MITSQWAEITSRALGLEGKVAAKDFQWLMIPIWVVSPRRGMGPAIHKPYQG